MVSVKEVLCLSREGRYTLVMLHAVTGSQQNMPTSLRLPCALFVTDECPLVVGYWSYLVGLFISAMVQ